MPITLVVGESSRTGCWLLKGIEKVTIVHVLGISKRVLRLASGVITFLVPAECYCI